MALKKCTHRLNQTHYIYATLSVAILYLSITSTAASGNLFPIISSLNPILLRPLSMNLAGKSQQSTLEVIQQICWSLLVWSQHLLELCLFYKAIFLFLSNIIFTENFDPLKQRSNQFFE